MWEYTPFFIEKDSLINILTEQGTQSNFILPILSVGSMFVYLIILFFMLKIMSKNLKDVEFVEEPVKQWQNLGGENLLESFYKDPERWGFSFEFYSMLTKIQALLKAAESDKPIIIIERSILSNKLFMDLSKELGKLDDSIQFVDLNLQVLHSFS